LHSPRRFFGAGNSTASSGAWTVKNVIDSTNRPKSGVS
jgi:hypothetical protein